MGAQKYMYKSLDSIASLISKVLMNNKNVYLVLC